MTDEKQAIRFKEYFGSDETFRKLKKMYTCGDMDSLADELLNKHVRPLLRKSIGGKCTKEVLEDIEIEAFMKLWQVIEAFLCDPRNDPDDTSASEHYDPPQRTRWFNATVLNSALKELKKINKYYDHIITLELFEDDTSDPIQRLIDPSVSPEKKILSDEALPVIMDLGFSERTKIVTRVIVSYTIIVDFLHLDYSRSDLVKMLDGTTMAKAREQMGDMLREYGYDDKLFLRSLDSHLQTVDTSTEIVDITASKLNSRKNDFKNHLRKMLIILEKKEQEEEENDDQ